MRIFLMILPLIVLSIDYLQKGDISIVGSVIVLVGFFLLANISMSLSFTKEAFVFKMSLLHLKPQTINWSEVESAKIVQVSALSDFFGWGIRWSRKYGWSYVFADGKMLSIKTKSGLKRSFTLGEDQAFVESLEEKISTLS